MMDPISRQAAIDAMCELMHHWFGGDPKDEVREINRELGKLPSVQPEIVRCKDCKHRDPEDKKCDSGHFIAWQLPRDDDWYCADAKRRTDDPISD